LAASVVILVLAPAVAFGTSTASAQPVTPPSLPIVVLTNASNKTTVVAHPGDVIVVALAGSLSLSWSTASAIPPTSPVLVEGLSLALPGGSSLTTFSVGANGMAQLGATGTPVCAAGTRCPQFRLLWRVTVIVPVTGPLASRGR
jgi:hypothetical protein